MTFGEDWGWAADKRASRQIFDRFLRRGRIFTDTANNYTDGTSQTWLGEVMASRRERFVIGTKYGLSASPHDPNAVGNHRKNLIQSLDASLRRLGTAYVDI
jgi:aryl-alcohol dehydrogenase-like predicted oxidoreductase